MKKYFIYARVASRRQADKNSSIVCQVKTLKELAQHLDVEVVRVYTEFSSANRNKEEFYQMMDKLANGEADGILCVSLDRLSRSVLGYQEIKSRIDSKRIQIITPSRVYTIFKEKKGGGEKK